MIKNKRVKRNWGNEDVSILLWVISKYCDMNKVRSVEKDLVCVLCYDVEYGRLGQYFCYDSWE